MTGTGVRLAVLGATGTIGRLLVAQALERGHTVIAVARDPSRLQTPTTDRLYRVTAEVHDPASIASGLAGVDVVLSGLGISKSDTRGTLSAGAHAVIRAAPPRIVWLGAFGTGQSARAAGALTRNLLALVLRSEMPDKVEADTAVLGAGGTVLHTGRHTDGPTSPTRRTVTLANVPRWPPVQSISRMTVAATMLDQAEAATVGTRGAADGDRLLVALR